MGASAVLSNGNATLSLNTDGTATNSVFLQNVTVTAKPLGGAEETAMKVNDALGLSNDMHATVLSAAKALDATGDAAAGLKAVGTAVGVVANVTGAIGAFNSVTNALENTTVGNVSKAIVDLALLTAAPEIAVVNGLLEVSGVKSTIFNLVDKQVDNHKSNQVLNSQKIDPSKIKVK